MKLTYKAIARMAGYRVTSEWRNDGPYYAVGNVKEMFKWHDVADGINHQGTTWATTEDAAWEMCCIENELIEVE